MYTFRISSQPTQHCLTPFIDIYDLEDKVIVLADMPGVSKEGLDVRADENQLTIHGRCSWEQKPHVDALRLVRECPNCDYYRVIKLSRVIDIEKIQAQIEDGILTLTLPKKQSAKSIEIPISV